MLNVEDLPQRFEHHSVGVHGDEEKHAAIVAEFTDFATRLVPMLADKHSQDVNDCVDILTAAAQKAHLAIDRASLAPV